jgi:hypothetical protein
MKLFIYMHHTSIIQDNNKRETTENAQCNKAFKHMTDMVELLFLHHMGHSMSIQHSS